MTALLRLYFLIQVQEEMLAHEKRYVSKMREIVGASDVYLYKQMERRARSQEELREEEVVRELEKLRLEKRQAHSSHLLTEVQKEKMHEKKKQEKERQIEREGAAGGAQKEVKLPLIAPSSRTLTYADVC